MTSPRDLFRVALQADANAITVVRGEPSLDVNLTVHDTRALKRFGETAGWLNIQFVDYLVLSTSDSLRKPLLYTWNAAGRLCSKSDNCGVRISRT
jgi:DNA repair protein RadC